VGFIVRTDFEKLMLEAIDEGLSSLGESSKQAIYFHLEKTFDIKREEIPDRVSAFSQAIENIFGAGAGCLEILIMERLYEKVGGILRWDKKKGFSFVEYVTIAKRSFRERSRIKTIKELVDCEEERVRV
jgi:hypothetical protein